jgi:hypothetical protein
MDRDQRWRRCGVFREVKIAGKLDAVVLGIGEAVMDRNGVTHFYSPALTGMQWQNELAVVEHPTAI